MKTLIIALCLSTGLGLQAQKEYQKEVDYQNQSVTMNFDLATTIEVKTWEKSSILVKAFVDSKDAKVTELYDLTVKMNGTTIEIASNTKEIFKVDGQEGLVMKKDHENVFNYTVFIPKGIELELSSITGDLTSEFVEGNISIQLVTGDIDIREFEGDLELKTVTGEIYLPAKNTSFKAKTVMGEIYANADPQLVKKDNFLGQEMALNLRQTQNRLSLNTVTGNIYLQ